MKKITSATEILHKRYGYKSKWYQKIYRRALTNFLMFTYKIWDKITGRV